MKVLPGAEEQQSEIAVKEEEPLFRNIDTMPKHLLHQTEADLIVPDKAMKEADLKELIKEARSKILPVIQTISDEEFKSIVKSIEVIKEDKQVIINEASFFDILH